MIGETVGKLSIILMLIILALAGCKIGYRGPIDYPPSITSNNPAEITVKRIWSLGSGAAPFTFLINDRDVYKLDNGESISFKIDPGEYKFSVNSTGGWKMWNSHHLYLRVLPGRSYRIILEADFNWGSSIKNATDN
jgi:hypothetical protein